MSKKRDISKTMLRFREALRHSWNTYFQQLDSSMGPDVQDAFSLVEQGLFQGLLLCSLDRATAEIKYGKLPLSFVQVVPRQEVLELGLRSGEVSRSTMIWSQK